MRLGFDGKRVIQNFTGLGNYSRYVLNVLTRYYPENSYHIYTSKAPDEDQEKKLGKVKVAHPSKKTHGGFWRIFSIVKDLKKDGIDLYHGLSNEIPVGLRKANISSVVTIHDLIFLRYPQYYKFIDRKIYYLKSVHACRNADYIIAVSEQTKRDIIHYMKVPENKIRVIYQNCDASFSERLLPENKEHIREAYNLPRRYLLNVGTIEPRKNLMLIAKSLKLIPDNIHLVVAGKETPYAEKVKNYLRSEGLDHRVHFLKNIKFSDLPAIYQLAEIFIYPSKFEGFGIPVVEALHSGVPVIAATGSCLEEAGGPNSYYVNPEDEMQLAKYINDILDKPDIGKRMAEKGFDYVKKFDDKTFASDLISIYKKAINND
jgi:glycosyltransferase involved in cell wall biosynthesis